MLFFFVFVFVLGANQKCWRFNLWNFFISLSLIVCNLFITFVQSFKVSFSLFLLFVHKAGFCQGTCMFRKLKTAECMVVSLVHIFKNYRNWLFLVIINCSTYGNLFLNVDFVFCHTFTFYLQDFSRSVTIAYLQLFLYKLFINFFALQVHNSLLTYKIVREC